MSLIDPSTRWWNRNRPRRTAAWVCWIVATAGFLAGGWSVDGLGASSSDDPAWLVAIFPISFLLLLGGIFLHVLGDDSEDWDPRVVFFPTAALFVAIGVGAIARALSDGTDPDGTSVAFAAVGVVSLVAVELLSRRLIRNRALRAKVERSGVTTTGQVTRARGYQADYTPVTRVTVKFDDHQGRTHWVSQTIGGSRKVGDRVTVRYSPDDLHRKAGVVVSPV